MDQAPNTPQPTTDAASLAEATSKTKVYWVAGIVLVAVGLLWYVASPKPSTSTDTNALPVGQMSTARYKDGTYTADGDYFTHAGPERITITLTLKDGVITDSQFTSHPNFEETSFYQGMFVRGYKQYVIGKNINDVHLSRVSGSSLTPMGFNAALAKIKMQAAG